MGHEERAGKSLTQTLLNDDKPSLHGWPLWRDYPDHPETIEYKKYNPVRGMFPSQGERGPAPSKPISVTNIVQNGLTPQPLFFTQRMKDKHTKQSLLHHKKGRPGRKKKNIFAMSYKDMERLSASREQPFSKSEVEELRRNRYLTRMAWEYWQRYFGGDSESERADAVRRLKRWVDLDSVLIPDSGADKMVMAGEAWIYSEIPGQELTEILHPYGAKSSEGLGLKIMRGKTCYLAPDGTPLAILVVKWGSAIPGGDTKESLLSEAQLKFLGCQDSTIGGIRQFHHHSWSEPLHCLPRGEGYMIPIRCPTKEELEGLPHWSLTVDYHNIEEMLTRMVSATAGLGAILAGGQTPRGVQGQKRKRADEESTGQSKIRQKKDQEKPTQIQKPSPHVGPRKETAEDVARALEEWRRILALPDLRSVERTIKVNMAEAVDLECEKRSYPRSIMKTRFPFLRPKYLGEACFTDVIEWKSDGVTKYQQTFLTQHSKFPYVVDIGDLGKSHEAIEKFVREVGVPTVLVSDGFKAINKSKKVKKLAGKLHMKLTTSEAYKQNGNKVEHLNGTLKQKSARMMAEANIEPFYTSYAIKYAAHVLKYTAHEALNFRVPIEALTGETGDISHLRFSFGAPVWYNSVSHEFPGSQMLKGIYLGPAESTGDESCHHILPLTASKRTKPKANSKGKVRTERRPVVIHRSYVTIRDPAEHSFREIHKTYERGFLFPRYLFPSRYDCGNAIDPEYVRHAHARQQPIVPKGIKENELLIGK